ncbi:MAG TPA: CRTAC1 family protein [Bryobacteraceae bacterium]|nr:CRTAC1 family protein [Bryobacteraceae bacterium]
MEVAEKRIVTRVVISVLFVCLLAIPLLHRYYVQRQQATGRAQNRAAAISHYGFSLQEVSKQVGINFVHKAPTLDPKLKHIMEQVASMGAAVSVVDFDHDGWDDIYVANSGEGSHNALYRNLGNGTFEDVADKVGLGDINKPGTGVTMGAVWGDYDNDGYEDVLIYKWGKPELYHNDGGKHFTRVTETAGLPRWVNSNTAIWFDYDNDGRLDLFLGGYYPENINLWKLANTKMMPDSFEYAQNGGRKYLFHNLGNGKFEEVSEKMGIRSRRWSLAAVAADFRGTGFPDLFVANDYGVSELYFNEGGHGFREVGKQTGVGYAPKSGMTASIGDVLNQGRYSIFVSNISEEGVLVQGNNLWMPQPGTSGDSLKYENMANSMGVELGGWSFGTQFGDLNNDGYLDLYEVNGNVSLDQDQSYWYDYSKVAGGNKSIISDAANWPSLRGRSLSGYQQKKVWINDGAGQFREVSQLVGATDRFDGRAIALADLQNNGALDAVVANQRGPLLLYKNDVTPANRWIEFLLEGTASNRSAIGAEVRVFWNGQQQAQEVSGGSGFCSQNSRRLHFGLGRSDKIDRVEIRWPSGKSQILDSPRLDVLHKVKEPA